MSEHEAGPELDALVAAAIGYSPRKLCEEAIAEMAGGELIDPECLHYQAGGYPPDCTQIEAGMSWEACLLGVSEATPAYSTDISAAWEVLETFAYPQLADDGPDDPDVRWQCCRNGRDGEGMVCAYAPTAPLAICRAALAAVTPKGGEP